MGVDLFFASNISEFRNLFVKNLSAMLSPDELGAYILVLANSVQDKDLRCELSDVLRRNERQLQDGLDNGVLKVTQDDIEVFKKLSDVGSSQVPSWEKHNVGVWQVVSNPFRALRPSRSSRETITEIHREFDADKFNFNKAFLKPEVLWEGRWESTDLKVLYNKFPFIPYHLIIVPEPVLQCPQFLIRKYHDMIWNLVLEASHNLPGFGAGYNSLGACASINHLHFHSFIRVSELPVESKQWVHNGGGVEYPMKCIAITDREQAWSRIQLMNEKNEPYNILYRPDICYLIPRRRQGDETIDEAVSGAGWTEESGLFVAESSEAIGRLTEQGISENLKSLSM